MSYALLIDSRLAAQIHSPYYLPGPVRVGLADLLDDLEQNPHVSAATDPILGLYRVHEQDYGSIHWRVHLFFERDDVAGIVYVTDWKVYTGPP